MNATTHRRGPAPVQSHTESRRAGTTPAALALLLIATLLATLTGPNAGASPGGAITAQAAGCGAGASKFTPTSPTRVADTRYGHGLGTLNGGTEYTLDLSGYIPAGATAVAVNATIIDPSQPLYLTLWPAGPARPGTSTVNAAKALETVANLSTVKVSPDRKLGVFASGTTNLALDLAGYYTPAETGSADGRFRSIAPQRIFDTRERGAQMRNERWDFNLESYGISAGSAVAVTVTATNVKEAGFVSVFPTFEVTGPPQTSNLNLVRGGQTVSNQAITATNNAWFGVAVMGQADVVVDVVGIYSNVFANNVCSGLLVPINPVRIVDTREPSITPYSGVRQSRFGETFTTDVSGISPDAYAVVGNLTVANITTPGYATAYDTYTGLTFVSSLYADTAGSMLASHIISGSQMNRRIGVFTAISADIIVDITGYYVDTPAG